VFLRIPASDRPSGRLAQLGSIPAVVFLLAACGQQANENPTGDDAAPSLFTGEVVTTQGAESASLYLPVFILAAAIFILVEGLLLFMAFRFRRRKSDTDLPVQTHGHNTLEIIWTAIPALVVTIMFVVSMVVVTNIQAKSDNPAVTVDVTAFQWQWTFAYADEGLSFTGTGRDGPEMVIPVDEPILVRLQAVDVIHSFYVPAFFYKLDAVPGRVNEFEFTVEQPGTYGGQCAEFCGLAHGDMFFTVRAVDRDEYDAWVEEETAATNATPTPAATPEPGATEAPVGTVLGISTVAEDPLAFTSTTIEASAGETVTVEYLNDSSLPHNISFYEGPDASAPLIAKTEIFTGPDALGTVTFEAPTTPGSYFFMCNVHPIQMTGTFAVVQ
jgi:cytochrome c oxidase subunit 2